MNKPRRKRKLIKAGCLLFLCFAICLFVVHSFLYPIKYKSAIKEYSAKYHVPPHLICAIIKAESGFNPKAVSSIGASGLMQITKDTFEWAAWRMDDVTTDYGDVFTPDVNIKYGTFIISLLLEEFKSADVALAAYHAGRGSVKKWLNDTAMSSDGQRLDAIPFKDTAWYVPTVLKYYERYKILYKHTFD